MSSGEGAVDKDILLWRGRRLPYTGRGSRDRGGLQNVRLQQADCGRARVKGYLGPVHQICTQSEAS